MYLPQQESSLRGAAADSAAVIDPLRYPVHNGEVLLASRGLSSIDEEQPATSAVSAGSKTATPNVSATRRTMQLPHSSSPRSTTTLSPLGENVSSSSTDPSNVTVLNINSSSSKGSSVVPKRQSSEGGRLHNRSQQESVRSRRDRPTIPKLLDTQVPAKASAVKKPQTSVAEFASSLTNALLETKELETVDLHDPEEPPAFLLPHFNDLSLKTSSPCDEAADDGFSVPESSCRTQKRLPKTPAPSVDYSAMKRSPQPLDCQKMPLNFQSLDFSLPESAVYEPEPVDFPSSPGGLRTTEGKAHAAGVVGASSPTGDYDSGCIYSAVASPPAGMVSMRKSTPGVPGSSRATDVRRSPQPSGQPLQQDASEGSSSHLNRRKKVSAKDAVTPRDDDEDQHSLSSLDDEGDDMAQMLSHENLNEMLTPDDINTPDELEESIMERLGPGSPDHSSRGGSGATQPPAKDESSFRAVVIQGIERRIDMQVIEPYKKVLSHGGHLVSGEAIIVFSACFLPDRARHDYDYVMDHLFMYVLTALDQLIAEDYVLVYLHGATTRANMPSFNWLKRCYQMIDRRLRKNLQVLYLVHPTFWVKTVVVMIRPFVSAKFSRKLRFVASLRDLAALIPMEQVCIPSRIKQYDDIRESLLKKDEQTPPAK